MRPFNARGWVQLALGLAFVAFGLFTLRVAFIGLQQGRVETSSRRGPSMVYRDRQPELYWVSITFWSGMGCLGLFGGYKTVMEVLRDEPNA